MVTRSVGRDGQAPMLAEGSGLVSGVGSTDEAGVVVGMSVETGRLELAPCVGDPEVPGVAVIVGVPLQATATSARTAARMAEFRARGAAIRVI